MSESTARKLTPGDEAAILASAGPYEGSRSQGIAPRRRFNVTDAELASRYSEFVSLRSSMIDVVCAPVVDQDGLLFLIDEMAGKWEELRRISTAFERDRLAHLYAGAIFEALAVFGSEHAAAAKISMGRLTEEYPRLTNRFREAIGRKPERIDDVDYSEPLKTIEWGALKEYARENPIRYYLDPYIAYGNVTMIAGAEKAGKSLGVAAMLAAMQTQTRWAGVVPDRAPVLYYQREEPPALTAARIESAIEGARPTGSDGDLLERMHFVDLYNEGEHLGLTQRFDLADERCRELLSTKIEYIRDGDRMDRPPLVVLDSLSSLCSTAAAWGGDVRGDVIYRVQDIARRTGAAIVVVCHNRKGVPNGNRVARPTSHDVLGDVRQVAAASSVIQFWRPNVAFSEGVMFTTSLRTGKRPPEWEYRIESDEDGPFGNERIVWGSESEPGEASIITREMRPILEIMATRIGENWGAAELVDLQKPHLSNRDAQGQRITLDVDTKNARRAETEVVRALLRKTEGVGAIKKDGRGKFYVTQEAVERFAIKPREDLRPLREMTESATAATAANDGDDSK